MEVRGFSVRPHTICKSWPGLHTHNTKSLFFKSPLHMQKIHNPHAARPPAPSFLLPSYTRTRTHLFLLRPFFGVRQRRHVSSGEGF